MAQFDHHHTSTVRSHPSDDSRPSPTTESYASETSHSEFSLPILHHIPITHKQQALPCKSTCLLLRNILLRGPLPHIANVENYHLFNLEAKYDTF